MRAMSDQWRMGAAGPYALDYNALPNVLRMMGIARSEWRDIFDNIQAMVPVALDELNGD